MKVRSSYIAAAILGLTLLGTNLIGPAKAVTVFTANLTHNQEVVQGTLLTSEGDPRPLSFGTAALTLNSAQTQLSFTATVFNIDVTGTQTPDTFDNLTAAHTHAGFDPTALTFPVVFGFFGSPFNDNNPNDVVVSPFGTGVGGTFSSKWDLNEGNNTTLAAQLANILAGRSYINFHTIQFPTGEIRGQIQAVPGPIAGAGLPALLALGGFVWARRRKAAAVA